MNRPTVVFLSTHNSTRSQMAEGLLREMAGDCYEAVSAGFEPRPVGRVAVQAMAEIGIDIAEQRAKGVEEFIGCALVAYVVTLCEQARADCPAFPRAAMHLHWPTGDTHAVEADEAEELALSRRVRDELADHVAAFVRQNCTDLGLPGRRFCAAGLLT